MYKDLIRLFAQTHGFPTPLPGICVGYEEITTEPFTTHLTTWISFLPVCQKAVSCAVTGAGSIMADNALGPRS